MSKFASGSCDCLWLCIAVMRAAQSKSLLQNLQRQSGFRVSVGREIHTGACKIALRRLAEGAEDLGQRKRMNQPGSLPCDWA